MSQTFDTYRSIDSLKSLFTDLYSGHDSKSFFIAFVRDRQVLENVRRPFRFLGFLIMYCIEGSSCVTIDQRKNEISGHKAVIAFPGSVISFCDIDDTMRSNLAVVAMSIDSLDQLPCDFKNYLPPETLIFRRAVVDLTPDIEHIVRSQISLANSVSQLDIPFSEDISKSMFSITLYLLMSVMSKPQARLVPHNSPKSLVLVSRFVNLLMDNYKMHRDISFYSDKLGVSPNYLSQRLKSTTGYNASYWIDTYLLSEAKNLLLLTTKPIQVISAELNFSGQASFSKYFKERTGLTPSQFRTH